MAKKVLVNVNGYLRNVKKILVNVDGYLRNVTKGFVNVDGYLRQFFSTLNIPSIAEPVRLSKSTDTTTYLVTLTGTNYYWSPNPTALTFDFKRSIDGGISWTPINSGTITNPSFGGSNTKTYLLPATSPSPGVIPNVLNYYLFEVTAANAAGAAVSSSYPTYSVTVQGPTNITLTAGTTTTSSIPINWTTSTGANKYLVEYKTNAGITWTEWAWTGLTAETITGLAAGTTYNIRVTPYTSNALTSTNKGYAGNTATVNATTVAITVPGAPTGLSATNVGSNRSFNDGRIDLSWTAPSNNGGASITGYRIDRSTDGSNFSVLVSNTGSISTSYSNTGLTSGQIYYYRVYAINSAGTGSSSNTANATATTIPQAPTIGTATRVSNTQVSITFTLNNNGGSAITSLIVASSPTVSLSYSGTSSPVTVTGTFATGQAYTFTVRAVNNNGSSFTSASSNSVTPVAAKLATPTGVNASDNRTDGINVTWNAVSEAAYYGIWYGPPAPSYNSTPDFENITTTSYLDDSMGAGVTRDYYVQAFRSGNPANTKSDWGGPDSGTRLSSGIPPSTPTNGGGTYSAGTNYVTNATFTRSTTGTTPITYYWTVDASASDSGPWTAWNSGSFSSSTLGGTANIPQQAWNTSLYGVWARYRVYAQNSAGISGTLEWLL